MRDHYWALAGVRGSWAIADVDADDRQANDDGLLHGERFISAYRTLKGEKIWDITGADRSSKCILLPEEY